MKNAAIINHPIKTTLMEVVKKEGKVPLKEQKRAKYKVSAHFIDEKLKYNKNNRQTNITGIRLTSSENKLIFCLCKLLHYNSNSSKPKGANFYTGNAGCVIVNYGDGRADAPKLSFKLYQLVKEYKGGGRVTGQDIINVKKLIKGLEDKKFEFNHIEETKKKGGGRIKREVKCQASLIQTLDFSETEYNKQNEEVYYKCEMIIVLNPIFRQQIESKYLSYPDDMIERLQMAYGSKKVHDITFRLMDYLNRERSNKRYTSEIGLEKLYYTLADNYMRQQKKGRVKKHTEKALITCIEIGLLQSYRYEELRTGAPKIVFNINAGWC